MTAHFDAERFRAEVERAHPGLGVPLVASATTGSTNDDAFDAALRGAPDGAVFVTDEQRAGRGRRGSTWFSAPGASLVFSVLLRRVLGAEPAELVPLAAGLSVREAVAHVLTRHGSPAAVSVKWPNDVLAYEKKLAGVLVESRVRGAETVTTVVGVGLNVGHVALPPEVEGRSTLLRALGAADVVRERLLYDILVGLARRLADLGSDAGTRGLIDELRRFDLLRGREIRVGSIVGEACGIDDRGSLLIKDARGSTHALRTGHVESW